MKEGLIISKISSLYLVEADKKTYECTARGRLKKDTITPIVGDRVRIELDEQNNEKAVIQEILPRNNFLKRPKMANLDQVIFVISAKNPKPDLLMLDKQLAYTEFFGIETIIVINKIDLEEQDRIENIKKIYTDIGYKVFIINAKLRKGVEELKQILKNKISAFSGNSGVGKSTLINSIFEEKLTEEGEISKKNKKGKNTTTDIKLYKIQEGTYIADTPGFAVFDIYEIETNDLYKYFREFREYEEQCEFVGCTHIKEETCGIRKAVEEKEISNIRYDNYVKIYKDLKDKEEHKW